MPRLNIVLALLVALIMAALLADASTAQAQTLIDDFENRDFYIQAPGNTVSQTIAVNDRAHCLAANRKLTATANGPSSLVIASLNAGFVYDDATVIDFLNGGEMKYVYELAVPTDLTEGGTVDRIDIRVTESTTDIVIWCWRYAPGGAVASTEYMNGPGTASFPLLPDHFDTAVTRIEIIVEPLNEFDDGRMQIADIRSKRNASLTAQFLGDFVATQIPPIPSSPLVFRALDLVSQPLYQANVALKYAEVQGIAPCMRWEWGEAPFYEGNIAVMRAYWDTFDAFDNMTTTVAVDLAPIAGNTPEIMGTPTVQLGTEACAVTFDALIRDGGGVPIATSRTTMSFMLGKYQELTFEDEMITLNKRANGTGFDVDFRLDGYNIEMNEPIFEIMWHSDYSTSVPTEVAEGVHPALDAGRPFALTAVPSITRGSTEIRATRAPGSLSGSAPGSALDIAIYDIAGRRVRTLHLARGASSIAWDGRDDAGASAPSGVYFARGENVRGTQAVRGSQGGGGGSAQNPVVSAASARIVRIR